MPLVHRLSGTEFESFETRSSHRRDDRMFEIPPTMRSSELALDAPTVAHCELCASRSPAFDLTQRCCVDRYETQMGSVGEHRATFAHAKAFALSGDYRPAQRLVESFRRAFGTLAAVELRRTLWRSVAEAQTRPLARATDRPIREMAYEAA